MGKKRENNAGLESWIILSVVIASSYGVYHYQFKNLPDPFTLEQAGNNGFSEVEAMKHVHALSELGPHPVGSDPLDQAEQYVFATGEDLQITTSEENDFDVEVEVEVFNAKSGANCVESGIFEGKTLVYSDLKHVLLRISPKNNASHLLGDSHDANQAILVSAHIDTVFSESDGAGDGSNVAVMLELARGLSQQAHQFKNSVIFLFNTGEEEGLLGSHSFITQHPWSSTVKVAIDLEAMGIGGKSGIFQAGPDPFSIENFSKAAKYPSGSIAAQDMFSSGVIQSSGDFQIYKDIGGLSGLDFAFPDNAAVYHTKNDKFKLLKPGSLQHLGENMLAFLIMATSSSDLPQPKALKGKYMITFNQSLANLLNYSVIILSIIVLIASLLLGGYPTAILLGLSGLSSILTLVFSVSFSAIVAFILPYISTSPVPFVANPWLAIGLFAAPALVGALTGQNLGYLTLRMYLSSTYSKRKQFPFSSVVDDDLVKLEAEGWLFKSGFLQWLVLLILGSHYGIGSSYIALFWLVPPALTYGLLESNLTTSQLPRPLKLATLLIGFATPIVISAGTFIHLADILIGTSLQSTGNPGSTPEWQGSMIISVLIATVICFTIVNILSSIHLSGGTSSVILAASVLFGLSVISTFSGIVPTFTEDVARPINVVHIVNSTGSYGNKQSDNSYIYLFSPTPGKLTNEIEKINEGFSCSNDKVDLVSFTSEYGCKAKVDKTYKVGYWNNADIPTLQVNTMKSDEKTTHVSIDAKDSTRWTLAINTDEVEDFVLAGNNSEVFVPQGNSMTSVDGWHTIQFAGGKHSPRKFELTLFRTNSSMRNLIKRSTQETRPLLKLRIDVDRVTPQVKRVLDKLPAWCSQYGKSTFPYNLAFVSSLPVDFSAQKTVGVEDH